MSWFQVGHQATCRRCFRPLVLVDIDGRGYREWRPGTDHKALQPQDCVERPGHPCTPHQPE